MLHSLRNSHSGIILACLQLAEAATCVDAGGSMFSAACPAPLLYTGAVDFFQVDFGFRLLLWKLANPVPVTAENHWQSNPQAHRRQSSGMSNSRVTSNDLHATPNKIKPHRIKPSNAEKHFWWHTCVCNHTHTCSLLRSWFYVGTILL